MLIIGVNSTMVDANLSETSYSFAEMTKIADFDVDDPDVLSVRSQP